MIPTSTIPLKLRMALRSDAHCSGIYWRWGCRPPRKRSTPLRHSTCMISSAGPPSGPERPNHKLIVKWPAAVFSRGVQKWYRRRFGGRGQRLAISANPHRFLGINSEGKVSVFETSGNRYGHIVLRGGSHGPNYRAEQIAQCEGALQAAGSPPILWSIAVMPTPRKIRRCNPRCAMCRADCHGNQSIIGLMLESHLEAGNQVIPEIFRRYVMACP